MTDSKFQVLLYYKYVHLPYPEKVRDSQRMLCEKLGLRGRIIVASEGINGTVEGRIDKTEQYILEMEKIKEFMGMSYKKSPGTGAAFPKLRVRVRPEIVTAHLPNLNPLKTTGKYLTSEELHEWYETGKEFFIVDMRNDYEYASGFFENFIPSGLRNFFDLQDVLPKLAHLKNKTIVTVCTGGVRCEKASGFLVEHGFSDVYQLKDGIATYMEKYPGEHFKGKLYVFDNRLTVGFNSPDTQLEVVGKCMHCGNPSENYVNCEYDVCHLHYICCENCRDQKIGVAFCKSECKKKYLELQSKRTMVV